MLCNKANGSYQCAISHLRMSALFADVAIVVSDEITLIHTAIKQLITLTKGQV